MHWALVVIGVGIALIGAIWMVQGLGFVGGGPEISEPLLAGTGSVFLVLGLTSAYVGSR